MKKIFISILVFGVISCSVNKGLPVGTIVSIVGKDTTRIGDSSWRYVNRINMNWQYSILKSTKKHHWGEWVPVGDTIKNRRPPVYNY